MLARMRLIGLEPGQDFDLQAVDPAIRQALERAPAAAQQAMQAKVPTLAPQVNGWQMPTETMGVYGNSYLKRATLARIGLGSNPPEDAIYPLTFADADGQPLSGENDYLLRFDSNELPPVNAFWSLTLYDTNGFQVANPFNRRALGDRDPLRYEADGSLELFIQHEHPGSHREANPSPAGRWRCSCACTSRRRECSTAAGDLPQCNGWRDRPDGSCRHGSMLPAADRTKCPICGWARRSGEDQEAAPIRPIRRFAAYSPPVTDR